MDKIMDKILGSHKRYQLDLVGKVLGSRSSPLDLVGKILGS